LAESANGDPVQAVLAYRTQIGQKAAELETESQSLGNLDKQIQGLERQLATVGAALTRLRSQAAKRLKSLVEVQFRELEMLDATFDVEIHSRAVDDAAVDSSGLDEMDFLVRTNPGQERLPLRKIASGGEISRIMLALKTILADKDQITVLVFDEIDANIGDRLGATIGRKMKSLAHGIRPGKKPAAANGDTAHQIICITHLSQIAACADRHLRIAKDVIGPGKDRQTVTTVRTLEGDERLQELAEMLGGKNPTEAAVAHARGLLQRAQQEA
jgi:DNA repair protein RecN (Recombination protein N)